MLLCFDDWFEKMQRFKTSAFFEWRFRPWKNTVNVALNKVQVKLGLNSVIRLFEIWRSCIVVDFGLELLGFFWNQPKKVGVSNSGFYEIHHKM